MSTSRRPLKSPGRRTGANDYTDTSGGFSMHRLIGPVGEPRSLPVGLKARVAPQPVHGSSIPRADYAGPILAA